MNLTTTHVVFFYLSRAEVPEGLVGWKAIRPLSVCRPSAHLTSYISTVLSHLTAFHRNPMKNLVALATTDPIDLQRENACH